MSDRSAPAILRRGAGGMRGQVIESLIQNPAALDPDIWTVMDQRDNALIEEEILHGAGSSKYVYQFSVGGAPVTGISVIGARELAAAYGGIKHRIIGSISKLGSMFVIKSYAPLGIFVQQIPELQGEPDFYEVIADITDVKTGNSVQIEKRETRLERRSAETLARNPNLPEWFERPHYQTIAGSKAYRNGVLSIIPQHVQLEWKESMLKLKKTDVITQSLIDEKRSGVLRYAATKAISVDRQAVEALTLDQIQGLSDAVREGKAEQFVRSAEALGIVVEQESERPARRPAAKPTAVQTPSSGGAGGHGATAPEPTKPLTKEREPAPIADTQRPDSWRDHLTIGFDHYAVDENGDPIEHFTAPEVFALWYAERYRTSERAEALRFNNQDALDEALGSGGPAKVIIESAHNPTGGEGAKPAAAPLEADRKPTEATPHEASPWYVPLTKFPNGKVNRGKYYVDVEASLATVPTEGDLNTWVLVNRVTYADNLLVVKVEELVEQRRAAINRVPRDIDAQRAADLIERFNAVKRQTDYDAILRDETVKVLAARMSKERPDLRKAVAEADKEAADRIKRAQQAPPAPPEDEEPPPIGEDDMPNWDRDAPP